MNQYKHCNPLVWDSLPECAPSSTPECQADQSGRGRSVSEQEAECRAICQREGWDVAEVLSDNDVGASRFSRVKDRPAYERLKQVLQAGDVLVLWEASRASRKLDGYVELRDLCAERGVLWNIGGQTYDPSRSNDRVMTESGRSSRRTRRTRSSSACCALIALTLSAGWRTGRSPTGYRRCGTPIPGRSSSASPRGGGSDRAGDGAAVPGGGVRVAIAKDLNERGVSTPGSSPLWRASIMTQMLKRPT
ncbi:recombinase family protein, partial [Rhodococcus hoagii]|nr:recombinase family protein [Prescottella equi]